MRFLGNTGIRINVGTMILDQLWNGNQNHMLLESESELESLNFNKPGVKSDKSV